MKPFRLSCTAILLASSAPALAQVPSDDIIVTAIRSEHRVQPPALVLNGEVLDERAPVAAADLFRTIPGLSLRVNSRGEAVVRVRGGEERQTTIFLDGAPLATPWDGRVDLALLPAGLIGHLSVIKGAAPLEYGANSLAGVIDMRTQSAGDALTIRAEAQTGTGGIGNASAMVTAPLDHGFSVIAGGAVISRDGEPIADRVSVSFDPAIGNGRSNTDLDGISAFGAIGFSSNHGELRLSLLHADVERGIAAQGDLDPAAASPRYWRYPLWSLDQLTLTGRYRISDTVSVRFTGWQQWFSQTIHAFRNSAYKALSGREMGIDRTGGARTTLTSDWGRTALRLSATAQTSNHLQRDATTTGLVRDFIDGPSLRYRQRLFSLGSELDHRLSRNLDATLGIGIDRSETPLTGDKPPQPSFQAISFYSGLQFKPGTKLSLTASLGRRSRLPSPRELFGEALGRLLINLDLLPERALLGDISAHWNVSDAVALDANLWLSDNDGTIGQRIVRVAGISRRQRFNMAGSRSYGLEASLNARISPTLTIEIGGAVQRGLARCETDGTRPPLLQRPRYQFSTALDWSPKSAFDIRAELLSGGSAQDLTDSGAIVPLPGYSSVNLRAFVNIGALKTIGPISLFGIAENLNNALVLPQSGFPAPGRTLRIGIRIGNRR